jgi:hypothetical protein
MQNSHLGVILEDIQDKLQSLAEAVSHMNQRLIKMDKSVDLIPEMAGNIKAIKLVARNHDMELKDHEQRIAKLEMPTRA